MSYVWAIWKPRVEDSNVRFLQQSDLPNSGFASVYRYSESDAKSLGDLSTFKGFKGVVHNEALLVDCDTKETSANIEGWLVSHEIGYKKYTTGNRGEHYHIPRITPPNHMLPTLDKAFVASCLPGADLSIYHHVALFRQEGCKHKKTGRKKELILEVVGKPLVYENTEVTLPEFDAQDANRAMKSVFGDRALSVLTVQPDVGDRHAHYIKIANCLDNLGQPYEAAYYYLLNVNLLCEAPIADEELHRILKWSYYERSK
jgi:hypothetical protein